MDTRADRTDDRLALSDALERCAKMRGLPGAIEPVGGGCINRAYKFSTERGPLFVKINDPTALGMFEAEARGLACLSEAAAVRVPSVIGVGATEALAFIALEWIDGGPRSADSEYALGAALARQHRHTSRAFGWERDNTIGLTPQINTPCEDWGEFFCERRLGFQLALAERNGLGPDLLDAGRRLLETLAITLAEHAPTPSLLHGDLWGGNWAATPSGTPFVFDPAVYFGDRETDLAMTRLFGGFGEAFYAAYEAAWPLPAGWQQRAEIYNLYHLLNHFNLFGAGYAPAIGGAIDACAAGL